MKQLERRANWGVLLVGQIISNLAVVGGTAFFSFWPWSSRIHWACQGMPFFKPSSIIAKSSREIRFNVPCVALHTIAHLTFVVQALPGVL